MTIDPSQHARADNYKLLTNLVVPRPIAWITSQNAGGVINLAPFSFFNAIGSDPLMVVIGVGPGNDGGMKDTARNINELKEFVVHLVTEELIDAMNISAADFPPNESELPAAGLTTIASTKVKVPRLAQAKAALECTLHSIQTVGRNTIILGQIVCFHVSDELMGERLHVNGFAPIGRLGSPSMYCRTTDRFDLPRLTYEQAKG
jgi:flavin reductase (DIM6/NTAB) family NADH-FMN oxidoreductase RutF